jgi:hypothetical protein
MNKIIPLCKKILENHGTSEEAGIPYFNQWSAELQNIDYPELLHHLMRNHPHRYVLDFILSTPLLWKKITPDSWINILRSASRPDTRRVVGQVGAFADIEFLSRYVGVDALSYLLHDKELAEGDRTALLSYFKKYWYALVPSELDIDDLDGKYFVDKKTLESLADSFCHATNMKRVIFNEENVFKHFNEFEH